MLMKALQVVKPRFFEQVQVPVPELLKEDTDRILVQPEWVSMCGSDIPFFTGRKRNRTYPLPAGAPIHECVGRVVESTSSLFHPGERVIAIPEGDQGLAEFFAAQAAKAAKLPNDLDDQGTSCLIQPLSTVLNAIDRLGDIQGKSIAVTGLGSIGLFFCWMLKNRGAARIVGIDPSMHRCQLAEKLGAARVYPAHSLEVLQDARRNPAEWDSPDICIEAVGHQMDTLNDCLELVRKQGTVLAFGVPDHPVYAIEYETFFRKNAHLLAAVTPRWSDYLAKARDIFLSARAELETFVTHRLPIRDAHRAFTLYEQHEEGILKALLDMSAW